MISPDLHRPSIRRARYAVLVLLVLVTSWASAQTNRVLVAPMQGAPELAPWQIAIPAALQRSLNAVPGVYVPPIGDPVVLADQATRVGADVPTELFDRFSASAFVAGAVERDPSGLIITLERTLADGNQEARRLTLPADPSVVMPAVVEAALDLLGITTEATRNAAVTVARQVPSVEGLQTLGVATSRLTVPNASALRIADDLAPNVSWILTERARAASLQGDHGTAQALADAATVAEPRDVEAWTLLGVTRARAGRASDAEAAYATALELNPSHALALAGRGSLLDGEAAVAAFEAAIEAYPRLVEAHLGLANELGGARGLQLLRRAGDALPESATLHGAIVTRAVAAGDPGGAVAYLQDVLTDPMMQAPSVYALAAELPVDRRSDALALLEQGAAQYPTNARIAVAKARVERLSGDPVAAEATLAPLVSANAADPLLANAYALALLAQARVDEARAVLEAAAGRSATVRFNLASAMLESGLAREAAAELAPDMTAEQRDPEVWALYGAALAGAGNVTGARSALEQALALNPDQALAVQTLRRLDEQLDIAGERDDVLTPDVRAAFDRGLTLLEQGRNAEAARELRYAYDAQGSEAPLLAFYLANALQRDGQSRDAIELYEVALAANPNSGTILNNIGFAWLQLGRYDLALPALRDAVEAAPTNARAFLNLGLTFYGLSRFQDAIDAWNAAIEIDPSLEPAVAASRARAQRQVDAATP